MAALSMPKFLPRLRSAPGGNLSCSIRPPGKQTRGAGECRRHVPYKKAQPRSAPTSVHQHGKVAPPLQQSGPVTIGVKNRGSPLCVPPESIFLQYTTFAARFEAMRPPSEDGAMVSRVLAAAAAVAASCCCSQQSLLQPQPLPQNRNKQDDGDDDPAAAAAAKARVLIGYKGNLRNFWLRGEAHSIV